MTGNPPADPNEAAGEADNSPPALPEKMSRSFYLALALIGLLVVMVVFLNYPAQKALAGTTMTQTNWTLQSLADNTGILVPAMSGTEVTAVFDRDGKMTGNAGCNHYSASYSTKDYQLSITGVGSTMMFCSGQGVMEQESAYLADLNRASFFRVSESFLNVYDTSGKTVLVFVPA